MSKRFIEKIKEAKTHCIGDGNCLFHAICCSWSKAYDKSNNSQKRKIAMKVRRLTQDMLSDEEVRERIKKNIPGLLQSIVVKDENDEDEIFETLAKELNGCGSLNYYFAFVFSEVLRVVTGENIQYIIVTDDQIIMTPPDKDALYGVILFEQRHYDCLTRLYPFGNPMIRKLRKAAQ